MVLTQKDLDAAVELLTERFTVIIDERITGVVARLSSLEDSVTNNKSLIDAQANEISVLTNANVKLRSHLDELSNKLDQLALHQDQSAPSNFTEKLIQVEERLEERTNRQLRQTLVFKGIQEQKNESWEDTFEILAEKISKILDISTRSAQDMLNRVHRGKPSSNRNLNSPRPIYAALHKWRDCEELREAFRDENVKGNCTIKVDFMFGPKTTLRRNLALLERKNLKASGTIVAGYLAYPARLMGKAPGTNNYILIEDFSDREVSLKSKY